MEVKTWKDIDRDSKIVIFVMTMFFFGITGGMLKNGIQRYADMVKKQVVSEKIVNPGR